MDSFEMTKIAGAVLAALLLIFGTKTAIDLNSHGSHKAGFVLAAADAPADAGAATDASAEPAAAAGPSEDFKKFIAVGNADEGKGTFSKCKACHVAEKDKAHTVGPNLWGVVNRKIASTTDFTYSEALKGKDGDWTFDQLAVFLKKPGAFAKGTKMVFAGISDPKTKADLIAYLATLADTPVPLPK